LTTGLASRARSIHHAAERRVGLAGILLIEMAVASRDPDRDARAIARDPPVSAASSRANTDFAPPAHARPDEAARRDSRHAEGRTAQRMCADTT
jgi:hypothetical protein